MMKIEKSVALCRHVKILTGSLCMILVLSLQADDAPYKNFENGNGSGNLASGAEYSDGTLPGENETVLLTKNYGMDLTFSTSATFEDLFIASWADYTTNTIVITDPSVKVTLKGVQDDAPGLQARGAQYSCLTLRGGTYDFNDRGSINPSRWGYRYAEDALILDGVIATNVYRIAAVYAGNNDILKVTNGSCVYVREADCLMDSASDDVLLGGYAEFSGGSKMVASDTPIQPFVRGMTNSTFVVKGEGTVLTSQSARSAQIFGVACSNDVMLVENGATLCLKDPLFCTRPSANNNLISIRSGGMLALTGTMAYFPYDGSSSVNKLEVLDEGIVRTSGEFNFRGRNTLVVDNGSLIMSGNFCYDAVGGCVRVMGQKAVFDFPNSYVFLAAKESTLEFSKNAGWSKQDIYMAHGGCSNTFAVTDGAAVSCVNFMGRSYGTVSTFDNKVLISDGGQLSVSDTYQWSGWNNMTVVSNATLECASMNLGDRLDRDGERELTSLNNFLVFQGKAPTVKASGSCYMHYGAGVRFELPRGGYPKGAVLFDCGGISYWNGDRMKLEIAGLDDGFVASLDETMDVTLIKSEGALKYYLEDQVKEIAPSLHPRAKLYFDRDNKDLHLKVRAIKGMSVILR